MKKEIELLKKMLKVRIMMRGKDETTDALAYAIKVLERVDEKEIESVIITYLIDTQKERILCNTARKFGKNAKVSKNIADVLCSYLRGGKER